MIPLILLIALALAFAGLAHVPAAQGALRGMGAVAAGLIAGTALRLATALRGNVLGPLLCAAVVAATFAAVALWRLPLVQALLLVALPACAWAGWRPKARP